MIPPNTLSIVSAAFFCPPLCISSTRSLQNDTYSSLLIPSSCLKSRLRISHNSTAIRSAYSHPSLRSESLQYHLTTRSNTGRIETKSQYSVIKYPGSFPYATGTTTPYPSSPDTTSATFRNPSNSFSGSHVNPLCPPSFILTTYRATNGSVSIPNSNSVPL